MTFLQVQMRVQGFFFRFPIIIFYSKLSSRDSVATVSTALMHALDTA